MTRATLAACLTLLLSAPSASAQVTLRVELEAETAAVVNRSSEPLALEGWTIRSVVGDQSYAFPAGTTVAPGDSIIVTSGPDARSSPPRVLQWTRRYIWNNDGDPGELRDRSGRVVARSGGQENLSEEGA